MWRWWGALLGQLFANLEAAENATRRRRIVAPHHHIPCIQGRFTLKLRSNSGSARTRSGDSAIGCVESQNKLA